MDDESGESMIRKCAALKNTQLMLTRLCNIFCHMTKSVLTLLGKGLSRLSRDSLLDTLVTRFKILHFM